MSKLVKYDAMCRAISEAWDEDIEWQAARIAAREQSAQAESSHGDTSTKPKQLCWRQVEETGRPQRAIQAEQQWKGPDR
jgi:hypothetical protein